MSIYKLHRSFIKGKLSLILSLIVFFAFRFINKEDYTPLYLWGSSALQVGLAFLLLYISHRFMIVKERSLLPAFFNLLFVAANQNSFADIIGSSVAMAIALCFVFLFSSYKNEEAKVESLNIGILVGLASLYFPTAIMLLPLFWIGMYMMKSLNIKTFLANITGLIVVCSFVFTWSIYNNHNVFSDKVSELSKAFDFQFLEFGLKNYIMIGVLALILSLEGFNVFMSGLSEKVQTKTILNYLYLFAVVVIILSITMSQINSQWNLICFIPLSYLFAHYFTFYDKKINSWLFFLCIAMLIGLYWL
ncbi:4-amino-4-deoxy-L-arabinose transferase-like glycosyltransferase [Dysgonomonadaceae bacterium PH5-43]|nr:4-amino-4-deoxy-L-arabinose transferase-like glycosyltransferase [Dysgonomonadaceae bacterium PH5-43]